MDAAGRALALSTSGLIRGVALARAGLVGMLATWPELVTVVGQVSATEASPPPAKADALRWDTGMPAGGDLRSGGGTGFDAQWLDDVGQPVVALVNDDRQAAAALAVGARGVLPRDAPAERIVAALAASQQGLIAVDESFAEALGPRRGRAEPLLEPLTPREVEVLGLIAEGLPNKTIAARLGISESTVKFHVNAPCSGSWVSRAAPRRSSRRSGWGSSSSDLSAGPAPPHDRVESRLRSDVPSRAPAVPFPA